MRKLSSHDMYLLDSNSDEEQKKSEQKKDVSTPNFLKAIFNYNQEGEEFIANEKQELEIQNLVNQFYGIRDEKALDKENQILQNFERANENRLKQSKQSLKTVSACSQSINQALIQQHDQWVQSMHNKFLEKTNKK